MIGRLTSVASRFSGQVIGRLTSVASCCSGQVIGRLISVASCFSAQVIGGLTSVASCCSGQVRMTCQPYRLHRALLLYKSHLLPPASAKDQHPSAAVSRDSEEDSLLSESHNVNVCLLSAYDVVGKL